MHRTYKSNSIEIYLKFEPDNMKHDNNYTKLNYKNIETRRRCIADKRLGIYVLEQAFS